MAPVLDAHDQRPQVRARRLLLEHDEELDLGQPAVAAQPRGIVLGRLR